MLMSCIQTLGEHKRQQKGTHSVFVAILWYYLYVCIYFRQSKNKSAISYDYDHQQGTAGGTKKEREDELSDESDNGNTHTLTLLF